MGPLEAKRFILDSLTIPAETAANFDNPLIVPLLQASESVDEEIESNGTDIASVRPYSKLTGMKGDFIITGTGASILRWMLYKDQDNEGLVTNLATQFHNSNDNQADRELRKLTLAKGILIIPSSSTTYRLKIFIKRDALKRNSLMRENDRIELAIASNAGTTCGLTGFGSLYCRHN